jgi:adenosine kinase
LKDRATNDGVTVNYMINKEFPTGTCAVLITGKDRSLVANLSAANHYKKEHIMQPANWAFVERAQVVYIAGFFLTVSPDTIVEVGQHCAENNKPFVMNLSAPFLCQFFKTPMMDAMPYVDFVFGNETEAVVFAKEHEFKTEDISEIALKIAGLPKTNKNRSRTVVFTQGKDPVIVAQNGQVKKFPIVPLDGDKILDTNGAGDAFAGGFLSQLVQGKQVEDCVRCGTYAASVVIQHSGCTFPPKPEFS